VTTLRTYNKYGGLRCLAAAPRAAAAEEANGRFIDFGVPLCVAEPVKGNINNNNYAGPPHATR
jgi:hypothetical protein